MFHPPLSSKFEELGLESRVGSNVRERKKGEGKEHVKRGREGTSEKGKGKIHLEEFSMKSKVDSNVLAVLGLESVVDGDVREKWKKEKERSKGEKERYIQPPTLILHELEEFCLESNIGGDVLIVLVWGADEPLASQRNPELLLVRLARFVV